MSSGVYNVFKHKILKKVYDLINDVIKVALMTDTHTFAPSSVTNDVWADLIPATNESSGTAYVAGGATLGTKTCVVDDTNNKGVFDGADVTWATSTIANARYAVIYDTTVTNDLILCIDFGSVQSSVAGDFKIVWNASGILTLS